MTSTGYAPCLVASVLLVVLTPTAYGEALTGVLIKQSFLASSARKQSADAGNGGFLTRDDVIASNTAPKVGNVGPKDEGVSQSSVSGSDRMSALHTLNGLRRSVQATGMNYVCWEDNVARYADYMASLCSDDATYPDYYDEVTYPPDHSIYTIYARSTEHSVASVAQYAFNEGSGSAPYKEIMQDDLSYLACGQKLCSLYTTSEANYTDIYLTMCILYYTRPFSYNVPTFTLGTACSACPSPRYCDDGLCRDDTAFKPALQCDYGSLGSPASKNSMSAMRLITVMVLTKGFRNLF